MAMTQEGRGKWDRFEWLNAIYEADLSAAATNVAPFLFRCANDRGEAWPSVATICAKISRSESFVKAALRELEKAGFIETTLRPGTSSKYALTGGSNSDGGQIVTPHPDTMWPPGGQIVTPGGSNSDPKQNNEQNNEQSQAARAGTDPDGDVYRVLEAYHEVGKADAYDVQAQQLLNTARAYGVPDAVEWLVYRVRDAAPRCKGGAATLTRWVIRDTKEGHWREWAAQREAGVVTDQGSARKTMEEVEAEQARLMRIAAEEGW